MRNVNVMNKTEDLTNPCPFSKGYTEHRAGRVDERGIQHCKVCDSAFVPDNTDEYPLPDNTPVVCGVNSLGIYRQTRTEDITELLQYFKL